MKDLKFTEILKLNKEFGEQVKGKPQVHLRLLPNITVNQLAPMLEYNLRKHQLDAHVTVGDYDNILQESLTIKEQVIPIVFWELCNLKDSFVYEIETLSDAEIETYANKIKGELMILFEQTKSCGLVILNKFSHLIYSAATLQRTKFEVFANAMNHFVESSLPANYFIVDIDKLLARVSIDASIDLRNYYSSSALYTPDFLKHYAMYVAPILLSINARTKKALILDCDNTLWKGIVGEDGHEKIEMSTDSKSGLIYREVQLFAKSLTKRGIVLGLNSKNNLADVDEVFAKRQDMTLNESDLIIKKVNWDNKATNLKEIANELNIGIDSLVFVDDSNFEVNLIRGQLPQVEVIQVPEKLAQYSKLISDSRDLFFSLSTSAEDLKRVQMYKENMLRDKEKGIFQNIEDYLASLEIGFDLYAKDESMLERTAQMTQKTNQFNLTTKRYSPTDIRSFYESADSDVICIDVFDKYGSSGVTGIVIVKYEESSAYIDSLLMSCRILGRNIEKAFLQKIIERIHQHGAKIITAKYVKTPKNVQVEEYYENNGFRIIDEKDGTKSYSLELANYAPIEEFKYIRTTWKTK